MLHERNRSENKSRKLNYSEKHFEIALVSAARCLHYQSKYIYLSVESHIKTPGYAEWEAEKKYWMYTYKNTEAYTFWK